MNITLDLVLPPIIVGMLILMIFSANVTMSTSTNENRLTSQLQNTANTTVQIVEEKIRGLQEFIHLSTDSSDVKFSTANGDTIRIYQSGHKLIIIDNGESPSTSNYAVHLSDIHFSQVKKGLASPVFLKVSVITESSPKQEVGERNHRFKALAERKIYLRNLHYSQL